MKTEIVAPLTIIAPMSKAIASESLQPDLLYMRSVLVSTGQNKNDDVFLPSEMWAARNSPSLKPVNWEHNSGRELDDSENPKVLITDNQIIGSIYDCYVADKNGNKVSNTAQASERVPENFDIVIESVIYKFLFPKTAAKIAQGATQDKLFVSMEAWFSDYDYLVGQKVIARNEETAFLDRHLRANGGDGTFGGNNVARILRNIVFGGVGVVAKPANTDSVIQTITNASEEDNVPTNAEEMIVANTIGNLDSISTEDFINMADNANTKAVASTEAGVVTHDDYKEVVTQLVKAQHDAEMKSQELETATAKADELQSVIDNLKSSFTKGTSVMQGVLGDEAAKRLAEADAADFFSVLSEVISEKIDSLSKASDELENVKAELAKLENQKRLTERLAQIDAELGLASTDSDDENTTAAKKEQRSKFASAVENLDDAGFNAWLDNMKGFRALSKPVKDETPVTETQETEAQLGILDSVKASETAPAAGADSAVGASATSWDGVMAGLVDELLGYDRNKEEE